MNFLQLSIQKNIIATLRLVTTGKFELIYLLLHSISVIQVKTAVFLNVVTMEYR